jgi:hypothetical protein
MKPFEASRLKITRARQHLASLVDLTTQHLAANPPTVESYYAPGPQGGTILSVIVVTKSPPPLYGAVVGDIAHNLRAALDLMAVDLVHLRAGNTKGVYFPFCDVPSDLEEMIKRKNFHRAGEAAGELLRDIKPYRGGNVALRALHDLDVQDKHRSLIPNSNYASTPEITTDWSSGELMLRLVEGSEPKVHFVFPDDSALAGSEIVETLEGLAQLVERTVQAFAALPR